MDNANPTRTHPLVLAAAVAVLLFSLVGIGAVLGWLPTSHGNAASEPTPVAADATAPTPATPAPAAQAPAPAAVSSAQTHPAAPKPAAKHVAASRPAAQPQSQPVQAAYEEQPVRTPAPVAKRACYDCGVIESVREISERGEGSGVGAVIGGVAGGVLGHQVGNGRGRDLATVVGAIGGGVAGHQVEKTVRSTKSYQITVRFDDGTTRLFTQDTPPQWQSGERIRVVDGVIRPAA